MLILHCLPDSEDSRVSALSYLVVMPCTATLLISPITRCSVTDNFCCVDGPPPVLTLLRFAATALHFVVLLTTAHFFFTSPANLFPLLTTDTKLPTSSHAFSFTADDNPGPKLPKKYCCSFQPAPAIPLVPPV